MIVLKMLDRLAAWWLRRRKRFGQMIVTTGSDGVAISNQYEVYLR